MRAINRLILVSLYTWGMKEVFSIDQTWLQCIHCGHKTSLLKERLFKCPDCGGLYDVRHDFNHLQSITRMKSLFDSRRSANYLSGSTCTSGVWRFKELIMPYLPDKYIVSLNEGNVPITKAGENLREWIGGDLDLWIIQEGMTPTGSFKDFGGTVAMSIANAIGIKNVACASTGDTSAMAAAYSSASGINCTVVLPEGLVTAVQLAQPLAYNAKIITVPGTFDACMRIMKQLVEDYGVYPLNSINPTRIEGHQATVFLLAQFFDWELPDWIAVPVGNGSNSSSIGKGMRLAKDIGLVPDTSRILGCQSHAASPLYNSWLTSPSNDAEAWRNNYKPVKIGETSATAALIGDPASKDKVIREVVAENYREGAMAVASEEDLNYAVTVCGKDGIFLCPQTGTVFAGLRNAVSAGKVRPGQRVVVVSTATGLKFTESVANTLKDKIIKTSDCETSTIAKIMGV